MVHARPPRRTSPRAVFAVVLLALGGLSCDARSDSFAGLRGTDPISVELTPGAMTLDEGATTKLTAVARDARGEPTRDQTITWSVGDTTVAAVDWAGQVAARRGGFTTITATAHDGVTGSATLTVRNASPVHLLLSPARVMMGVHEFGPLTASLVDAAGNPVPGPPPTWVSSNPAFVTVNRDGVIDAAAEGSAVITAMSAGAVGSTLVTVSGLPVASVTLTLPSNRIRVGDWMQATAVAKDAAGHVITDRLVRFTSSSDAARVTSTGLILGAYNGKTTISASAGGQSASAFLFVALGPVDLLTITPPKATLIAGQSVQLRSIARDHAGSLIPDAVVTYTSGNPDVARVDASGVVTGVSRGSTVIVGTSEGKSASVAITVLAPPSGSWARFDSDPGDWVGQGNTYSYTAESNSITAQARGVRLDVFVAGGEGWIGNMAIPQSLGRLQTGTYQGLTRIDFSDPAKGGIYWESDLRGCNETLGSITIDSVRYAGDTLRAIDLRFLHYCDRGPALRGIIHWRAESAPASTTSSRRAFAGR